MRCFCWLLLILLVVGPGRADTLDSLLEAEWQHLLSEDPLVASWLGIPGHNDGWPDLSASARKRRHEHYRQLLSRLDRLEGLAPQEQLNLELFREQIRWKVQEYELGLDRLAINQRDGIQTIGSLADALEFSTLKDYEDWVTRLETFPGYAAQTIELLREGIKTGVMQPRIIVERLPRQLADQMAQDPTDSIFYKPFKQRPPQLDQTAFDSLAERARHAISEGVVPAYGRLHHFIEQEYLPASPQTVGASQWPQGQAAYQFLIGRYTTTDMTADQIHQLGLAEVQRIRGEMEQIIHQVGFRGSFREFLDSLRTDPRFYYHDSQELLKTYRAFCNRVDLQMPTMFGKLPRRPYGVEPIPDYIAPDTTTAYYMPPSGSRAGIYYVNLYQPEARPKYEIEVLTLHESVPGHHHQIALALELEGLPAFRRYSDGFGSYTVFVEGWALYAESLGYEMGFYEDPYSKFGQLTYDMWRAVRLVLDTGIHAKGWTRQQAIDFFLENTAKTKLDIVNEVDRYIAWPGQALAYKIGQLKIRELRTRAEKELGPRFDLRAFHDVVLGQGAVSLKVLEQQVDAWVSGQSGAK
ncbi:MAG: DUF885 family protein [Vulcanimicrobiota bacterium]